jgi:hypothetical protein
MIVAGIGIWNGKGFIAAAGRLNAMETDWGSRQ